MRPLNILCGAAALLRGSGRFCELFHKAIVVFPIGSAWLCGGGGGCHGVSVVLRESFRGSGRAAHPMNWHPMVPHPKRKCQMQPVDG